MVFINCTFSTPGPFPYSVICCLLFVENKTQSADKTTASFSLNYIMLML